MLCASLAAVGGDTGVAGSCCRGCSSPLRTTQLRAGICGLGVSCHHAPLLLAAPAPLTHVGVLSFRSGIGMKLAMNDRTKRLVAFGLTGFAGLFVFMGLVCLAWGANHVNNLDAVTAIWGGVGSDLNNGETTCLQGNTCEWYETANAPRSAQVLKSHVDCVGLKDVLWSNASIIPDDNLEQHYLGVDAVVDFKLQQCEAQKSHVSRVSAACTICLALSAAISASVAALTDSKNAVRVSYVLVAAGMAGCVTCFTVLNWQDMHVGGMYLDCEGMSATAYSSVGVDGQPNQLPNIGATSKAAILQTFSATCPNGVTSGALCTPEVANVMMSSLYMAPTPQCMTNEDGEYSDALAAEYLLSIQTALAGAAMLFIALMIYTGLVVYAAANESKMPKFEEEPPTVNPAYGNQAAVGGAAAGGAAAAAPQPAAPSHESATMAAARSTFE